MMSFINNLIFTKLIFRGRIDTVLGGWLSGESACFTRKRSVVQIHYRPPFRIEGKTKTFEKTFALAY